MYFSKKEYSFIEFKISKMKNKKYAAILSDGGLLILVIIDMNSIKIALD